MSDFATDSLCFLELNGGSSRVGDDPQWEKYWVWLHD